MQSPHIFTVFKMERVLHAVAVNLHIHIFGCILCRAKAQTVESKRVFVAFALIRLVFAACVQLAEYQLPIVPALALVKIDRNSAAKVLDLNGLVAVTRDQDFISMTLARFVDGI